MSGITVTEGTQSNIATDKIGTVNYQIVKMDVGALGASSPFTGTVGVDNTSLPATYWGTTIFTGTNTMGTIKAAVGAGTCIYVTDLIISVGSASQVVIGDGTITTPLAGTYFFAANGGLTANFRSPIRTSQGGTLVFAQSAAVGSCTITALGYTAP